VAAEIRKFGDFKILAGLKDDVRGLELGLQMLDAMEEQLALVSDRDFIVQDLAERLLGGEILPREMLTELVAMVRQDREQCAAAVQKIRARRVEVERKIAKRRAAGAKSTRRRS